MSQTHCFKIEGKGQLVFLQGTFFKKLLSHPKLEVKYLDCLKVTQKHQKRVKLTTIHSDCPPVHCGSCNLLKEVNPFCPKQKGGEPT